MELIAKRERNGGPTDIGFEQQPVASSEHLQAATAQAVKDAWISGEDTVLDVDFVQDNGGEFDDCCSCCDYNHVSPEQAENDYVGTW